MSRRESTVASTIRQHYQDILRMWRTAAETSVSARGLTGPECMNLMPAYIHSLTDEALGPLGENSNARLEIVEDHLGSRLRHGFELSEIVEEFELLGRCVSRVWRELRPEHRPDPIEIERFYAELHQASARAARIFEEHMLDEEQTAKRFSHRLESVAMRSALSALDAAPQDLSPLLGVIVEAAGAGAAAIAVESPSARGVTVCTMGYTPAAAAAVAALARGVDLRDDDGDAPDPIRSRQVAPGEDLKKAGLKRAIVTRFPAGEHRRAAIAIASAEERAHTAREIRRVEALAERLALHLETSKLHADLRSTIAELRAEKALREAFVAVLAHDLRGPLSTAQIQAHMLGQTAHTHEDVRAGAARIERVLGRADRMVRDLLDANRIRAGEPISLSITMFDLRAAVRDTLEELSLVHPGRFVLDAHGPVEGFWSLDQVRRAVWNLGVNAIKYGLPARPVTVSIRCRGDIATIAVHNDGHAIPVDQQAGLFDAFKRAATEGPPSRPGWGLGLTLVRGAAEAHGGHIRCQSDAEHGTTFTIELPVDARPYQRDSLSPGPPASAEAPSFH